MKKIGEKKLTRKIIHNPHPSYYTPYINIRRVVMEFQTSLRVLRHFFLIFNDIFSFPCWYYSFLCIYK